jgi:hypothetical protein
MGLTYAKNPDVVFRAIADEFILVPIRQKAVDLKSVYTLNGTGAFIWGLIDGTASAGQIEGKVCAAFAVDPAQAHADVAELLAQLEGVGLVRRT